MKDLHKKIYLEYIPLTLTFIGIVSCAIIFKQDFIKTLPTCFSLVIVLLTSRANRIAFLLGAGNCCIYIIGYFMEGVYGTMASTAFSAIMQTATFFTWRKHAYKQATEFKTLSNRNRILIGIGLLIAWGIAMFVLSKASATEFFLDGLLLILGIAIPVMQLFALIDSLPLYLLNSAISCVMWLRIIFVNGVIADVTYLISSIFGLYMTIRTAIKWIALYKEQRKIK